MFVGIGGKLMQGKADVLHSVGTQKQGGTVQLHAGTDAEQIQMSPHQIAKPCSLPILAQHEVLRLCQALDALAELLYELVNGPALTRGLQRHPLHDRKLVLRAMREFAHQERRVLVPKLQFR